MKTHVLMHPRAEELLVERALRPLSPEEELELESLGVDRDETVDLAAAALAVATARADEFEMPVDLMAKLEATIPGLDEDFTRTVPGTLMVPTGGDLRRTLPGVVSPGIIGTPPSASAPRIEAPPVISLDAAREKRKRTISPAWFVAAASIALAVGAVLWANRGANDKSGDNDERASLDTPATERAQLLAAADAKTIAWTPTEDKAAKGASGDVVWSKSEQRGFMRFNGLAANNPSEWQYQLWIFDGTRDQAFPVDGGVFDVGPNGEVIVPISAKLHVTDATLFAVTIEKPGGVVVSKRERLVVLAKAS